MSSVTESESEPDSPQKKLVTKPSNPSPEPEPELLYVSESDKETKFFRVSF